MPFDPAPKVNNQGDSYLGQEVLRYQVTNDLDNVDKWGKLVMAQKAEQPSYEKTPQL